MTFAIISRIRHIINRYVINHIMFAIVFYRYRLIWAGPINPALYAIVPAIKKAGISES